jgi:hypothetical protein
MVIIFRGPYSFVVVVLVVVVLVVVVLVVVVLVVVVVVDSYPDPLALGDMQDATSTISVRTFIYNEPLLPDELGASSRPAVANAWSIQYHPPGKSA